MFIVIEELQQERIHVRHRYGVEELSLQHEEASLEEPVEVDFVLRYKDGELHLVGSLGTSLRHLCSRCLKEFSSKLSTNFDLLYLPHPEDGGHNEEVELQYEDMFVGFYDGISFDVDLMALEQIELAIPMKLVCRQDCLGLCHRCGADLNEGGCACKDEQVDSRLAVLQEFREKMDRPKQREG